MEKFSFFAFPFRLNGRQKNVNFSMTHTVCIIHVQCMYSISTVLYGLNRGREVGNYSHQWYLIIEDIEMHGISLFLLIQLQHTCMYIQYMQCRVIDGINVLL